MLLGHPVNDQPDLYDWHRHRRVRSFARLVRRKGATLDVVRLQPHHDPHHPAGFLVLSCPQRPGFRADLGLERTFPPAADGPTDHLFLELTTTCPTRRPRPVHEICEAREPIGEKLTLFTREIRKYLLGVCQSDFDRWWFSSDIREHRR